MTLALPCTYPVRPSPWTRARRWVRRLVGLQTQQDAAGGVCGATAAHSACCGVCGHVVAACSEHGAVMGVFRQMHQHLETHRSEP